jgi:hypothetical protein
MDKKQLHHLWTRVRPIKPWHLLLAFLLCAALTAFALRQNNLHMSQLRQDLYTADQQNQDVEGALQKLRTYVYGHMNTSLARPDGVYPPIQLASTYQRLQQAEQDKLKTTNTQVYSDAQAYCEKLYPGSFSGGPRVPCIESYVTSHGVQLKTIPDALYKFDFISPTWSPDLAGWLVVLSTVLFVLLAVRFALGRWLHRATHG